MPFPRTAHLLLTPEGNLSKFSFDFVKYLSSDPKVKAHVAQLVKAKNTQFLINFNLIIF
jgi:hypothetical protein